MRSSAFKLLGKRSTWFMSNNSQQRNKAIIFNDSHPNNEKNFADKKT